MYSRRTCNVLHSDLEKNLTETKKLNLFWRKIPIRCCWWLLLCVFIIQEPNEIHIGSLFQFRTPGAKTKPNAVNFGTFNLKVLCIGWHNCDYLDHYITDEIENQRIVHLFHSQDKYANRRIKDITWQDRSLEFGSLVCRTFVPLNMKSFLLSCLALLFLASHIQADNSSRYVYFIECCLVYNLKLSIMLRNVRRGW